MKQFEEFVDTLVELVPPDRRSAVRAELLDHLESAYEAERPLGLDDAGASNRAIASLGRPRRLRRQLWVAEWRRILARAWPALVIASLIAGLAQLVAIAGATGRFALPGWQWSTQLMAATPIIAWVVLSLAGRVAWPHALGLAALAGTFRLVGLALHAFWPEVRGGSEEHVLSVMLMRDLTIGCLFSTLHIVAARRVGGRVVALREALFLVGASRVMFIGQVAWCLVVNRTLRTPEFDAPSITTTFLVGIVWCLAGLLIAIRIAPLRETAPQATTK